MMKQRLCPYYRFDSYDSKHTEWLVRTCQELDSNEWSNKLPVSLDGIRWDDKVTEETSIRLFSALRENVSARALNLKNLNMGLKGERAFEDMLQENKSLTSIKVDRVESALPRALFEQSNIEELEIGHYELDSKSGKSLAWMIKSGRSLRVLKLSNLTLSDEVVTELADALETASKLHCLELNDVNVLPESMKYLLNSIAESSSLRSVHLNDCGLGWAHSDGLAKLLQSNANLSELSVCGNNLDGNCVKIFTEDGLTSNCTLSKLSLDGNPIGDDGAMYLADALQVNSTLKVLTLEDTEVWQDGCEYFSQRLATMPGLRKVILDGNDFEDQVDTLLQSMKKNMMVTQLFVTMIPFLMNNYDRESKKKWELIDLYLRSNRANRRIVKEPTVPHSLWTNVLEKASKEPDTIHLLLMSAPELFCDAGKELD